MSLPLNLACRPALRSDAPCLSVLGTQVFLDTYATHGISADLAHEAQQLYSPSAFDARLGNPKVNITVAEARGNLVGFVDLQIDSTCPVAEVAGPEVLRLYVQRPFQRQGVGQALLKIAEAHAQTLRAPSIWLTAWVDNTGALDFYSRVGYEDAGTTQYFINGKGYENRVFAKVLGAIAA